MDYKLQKPRSIKELLGTAGKRLSNLAAQAAVRTATRAQVCDALPPEFAAAVVSAGLKDGQLTVGVNGGQWATRLRYMTDTLRQHVGAAAGVEIQGVRIRVVPPRHPEP